MYAHILVATDGSDLAQKAIIHAVALAALTQAELSIVKVIPHYARSYFEGSVPVSLEDEAAIEQRWADDSQVIVDAARATAQAQNVKTHALVLKSDIVGDGIIEAAKRSGADLIVMASHGRRGIQRLLLGSETQHVLTHSHTPVLVLR